MHSPSGRALEKFAEENIFRNFQSLGFTGRQQRNLGNQRLGFMTVRQLCYRRGGIPGDSDIQALYPRNEASAKLRQRIFSNYSSTLLV